MAGTPWRIEMRAARAKATWLTLSGAALGRGAMAIPTPAPATGSHAMTRKPASTRGRSARIRRQRGGTGRWMLRPQLSATTRRARTPSGARGAPTAKGEPPGYAAAGGRALTRLLSAAAPCDRRELRRSSPRSTLLTKPTRHAARSKGVRHSVFFGGGHRARPGDKKTIRAFGGRGADPRGSRLARPCVVHSFR